MKRENMGQPKHKRFVLAGFCFFIVLAGVLLGCEKEEGTYFSLQQVAKIQPENVTGLNLTYQTPYPSVDVTDAAERNQLLTAIAEIPVQRSARQPGAMDGGWNLCFRLTNQDGSIKQVDIAKDSLKITTIDSNGNRNGRDVYYDISPAFEAGSFIRNIVERYRMEWTYLSSILELSPSEIVSIGISENGGKQTKIEDSERQLQICDFLVHISMESIYEEAPMETGNNSGQDGIYFLITYQDGSSAHVMLDLEQKQGKINGRIVKGEITDKWRIYSLVYHSEKEQSEQQERLNEILSMSAAD